VAVLPDWEIVPLEDDPVLTVPDGAAVVVVAGGQLPAEEELCPADVAAEIAAEVVPATEEDTVVAGVELGLLFRDGRTFVTSLTTGRITPSTPTARSRYAVPQASTVAR
jgi:F420-0:gamma-glutamyl ligase